MRNACFARRGNCSAFVLSRRRPRRRMMKLQVAHICVGEGADATRFCNCFRSLMVTLLMGVCLSAQANTVGWWRMEGTSGELAQSIANEIDPEKLSAVFNGQGTASRFSETFVPPVSSVAANRASVTIAAAAGDAGNMHQSKFEVTDDGSHSLRPASFTLEAFFKWNTAQPLAANATAGIAGYIHDSSVIACSYGIGLYGNTVIAKFYDGADRTLTGSSGTPRDGKWHHLAVTFDHATRKAELWLDYKSVGTMTLTADLVYADNPLCIGCFGERGMVGWVDEVRLSDCALGADEFLDARLDKGCLLDSHEPAETLFRYRMGDAVQFPQVFVDADATCGWCSALPAGTAVNLADWTTGALVSTTAAAPAICDDDSVARKIRYAAGSPDEFVDEKSVSFSGKGAYRFEMKDKDQICGGDFTAELFFRAESPQEYTGLLRQLRGTSETATAWQLGMRDLGVLVFSSYAGKESEYSHFSFVSKTAYADGLWHHVAAVYRAATTNVTLYYDGIYDSSVTLPLALTDVSSGVNVLIGRRTDGFDGCIDEVRITGRALESAEFLAVPQKMVHYGFDGSWEPASDFGAKATPTAYEGGELPTFGSNGRAGRYLYSCHTNVSVESFWSTNAQYVTIDRGQVSMSANSYGLLRVPQATTEAFVRFPTSALKQFADVLALFDGLERIWTVRVDAGSKLYVLYNGTSSIFRPVGDAKSLNDGNWHHLAVTINQAGDPVKTTVSLFIDYEPYASGTVDGAIPYRAVEKTVLLQASSNNNNNFQAFDLDEVRYTPEVKEPGDFIGFGRNFQPQGFLLIYR